MLTARLPPLRQTLHHHEENIVRRLFPRALSDITMTTDLERRLESIALTYLKQREAGEKPDMTLASAARALGVNDLVLISRIRSRSRTKMEITRRSDSQCIFAEADRIAGLR